MANPRIEFYRFTLNPKTDERKTFKDFAKDELKAQPNETSNETFKRCFSHFISDLQNSHATNATRKQTLTVIPKKKFNPYLDLKPTLSTQRSVISGVINGGPYDKEAVVSNIADNEDNSSLGRDKSVLLPYFVFLYVPQDYNSGYFAIHAYSQADNITALFKNYVSKLFAGRKYKNAIIESFAPMSFQKEFKEGAVIQSLGFTTTLIETMSSTDPIIRMLKQYNIKIEAVPKNKDIPIGEAAKVFDFFKRKMFKKQGNQEVKLEEFDSKKLVVKNDVTQKPKTFEWNTRDNEFAPTVYLENRVKIVDGVPDFKELKKFCDNLYDEILPEVRPDLTNVAKAR